MCTFPNFFLIGAPKCGTSSLHAYLGQHPEIYVTPVKEPCYFADEVRPEHLSQELLRGFARNQRELRAYIESPVPGKWQDGLVLDWDLYRKLYNGVKNEKAVGEASVIYLWSQTAARNISARVPEARILMILRDPADRAFSQYLDCLTAGLVRHSFSAHIRHGLAHRGNLICRYHPFLEFGGYAAQIRRYLEAFPRERVHILFYEDFQREPDRTMEAVFRFLRVDPGISIDMSKRHRQPRVPRFGTAGFLLKRMGIWKRGRRLLPDRLAAALRPLALTPRNALVMDAEDRAQLVGYYRRSIEDLQDLLNRDLSAWLRCRSS